jgi:hypothetical protein
MLRILSPTSAGFALFLSLFPLTASDAQEAQHRFELPRSIISLAAAPRPQGQLVARNRGDATFGHAPANYHVFSGVTAGDDAGVETLQLNFAGETRLTKIQSKSKDFVVEPGGSCHEGNVYTRGDSCTLAVRFNPQGPGHRNGSISITHSAEATPMFVGLSGNGYAPVINFTPSQITTVTGTASSGVGTIKSSANLAVDGGDILYVPDIGNSIIKMIDSSGAINTRSPIFATPASLVADSSGFLYSLNTTNSTYYFSDYAPWGSESAYGTNYSPGTCTPSSPCPLTSVGMSRPANISIDAYDNLFFEEGTKGAAEMPVANLAGGSGSLSLWYLTNQFVYTSGTPASFAVDNNDNIYNFYNWGASTCYIQGEPLYNAEYSPVAKRIAGGSSCGFSGDGGQARSAEISSKVGQIAFDIAGNLYFADAGNQRIRRIEASTGIISTIAGSGAAGYSGDGGQATSATLSNPTGLAVDSQGQVYILSNAPTAGPTQVIRKVGIYGSWNFGGLLRGTSSAAKVITVANNGNSAMTLSANALFNGTNPTEFSIDPVTTSCVLTANATLAAGHSCFIGIIFKPAAVGLRTASLTLLDNTVTGSNTIKLYGTGTLPAPTMKITSPAASSSVKAGVTVTFAVSVTTTSSTKPTGTVTFKVNGANVGTPVTLSSTGTASTTFTESSASTYTLSAVYSGDTNYASVTVSESLTVTAAAKAASTVSLSQQAAAVSSCAPAAFAVRVASASGSSPTGKVELKSGATVLASSTLSGGKAMLSAGKLSPGTHTLVAAYGGDSRHLPASSAPIRMTISGTAGSCGVVKPAMPAAFIGR